MYIDALNAPAEGAAGLYSGLNARSFTERMNAPLYTPTPPTLNERPQRGGAGL